MRLFNRKIVSLALLMLSQTSQATPFFIGVYVVPPPDQPEIDVRIDFIDADDGTSLGGVTEHIDGSQYLKETVVPNKDTKHITIRFAPMNVKNYKVQPTEHTVELSRLMQAKTVTWIGTVSEDKAYLDNVTTAGLSLKKRDADDAIRKATYAGAVATTANQRLEAARVEAEAYLAKNDPMGAVAACRKVANEGFDKADPIKKKVFLGEWLDVLEEAAVREGVTSDSEGHIFAALKADSSLREEFSKLSDVFSDVVPTYKQRIVGVAADDIAEKEKRLRAEMAIILRELRRIERQRR